MACHSAAITRFCYSKACTPDSSRFYRRMLSAFQSWAKARGAPSVDDITNPLPRRYLASPWEAAWGARGCDVGPLLASRNRRYRRAAAAAPRKGAVR